MAGDIDANNDLSISSGDSLDVSGSDYEITVGGSWSNSGTFIAQNGKVTFDATASGKTITDGGWPFHLITFNGSGGSWLYQDSTSTAPATTTVQNGTSTFLNAKTGGVSFTDGELNVDWYLGIHVVAGDSTSTDIGNATTTISEKSATPQATIWKMLSNSWGTSSTTATAVTQTGNNATGTTPQPNSDGAIRIREYSRNSATTTYYKYNLTIPSLEGFYAYNYYTNHGSNYLISTSSAESANVDKCISVLWHRAVPGTMWGSKDYDGLNEPPDHGSWYAGMSSDLKFSISTDEANLILKQANDFTTTTVITLSATTSYDGGFTIKAYMNNNGELTTTTGGIDPIIRFPHNNDSPHAWATTCSASSTCCGFGYTTDDNTLPSPGAADRFSTSTLYAGFATSSSNTDPVADTDSNEPKSFDNILRVSVDTNQEAAVYTGTITYICTVNY